MAEKYGLHYVETLTGFKYIGEQIHHFELDHSYNYVFGLEESYGCLAGTHARDKDAPVAVMMLCEAAAFYKKQGLTLWDQMQNIYREYGYYKETQIAITMKGIEGAGKIQEMMNSLRENPPKKFGKWTVEEFRDYDRNIVKETATGETHSTGLPKSNVLYFALDNDAWVCARPSGTEPKIKFYIGVRSDSLEHAAEENEELSAEVKKIIGA